MPQTQNRLVKQDKHSTVHLLHPVLLIHHNTCSQTRQSEKSFYRRTQPQRAQQLHKERLPESGCDPLLNKCKIAAKHNNQLTHTITEVQLLVKAEDQCVSTASVALSKKEPDFLCWRSWGLIWITTCVNFTFTYRKPFRNKAVGSSAFCMSARFVIVCISATKLLQCPTNRPKPALHDPLLTAHTNKSKLNL